LRSGQVAAALRAEKIPVIDALDEFSAAPDVVHGHYRYETARVLLRFPNVPALYMRHDSLHPREDPPQFERIRAWAAVDEMCRKRLAETAGVTTDRVHLLLNFVDLVRFQPRPALPKRPRRALVFSNYRLGSVASKALRSACGSAGIKLDLVGASHGNLSDKPEKLLPAYDLVFAKGRAALEAMAVGTAVVPITMYSMGPLVTSQNFDRLRALNFGLHSASESIDAQRVALVIKRYDAEDAGHCSQRVRREASRDGAIDALLELYRTIVADHARAGPGDTNAELREAARLSEPLSSDQDLADVRAYEQALKRRRQSARAQQRRRRWLRLLGLART